MKDLGPVSSFLSIQCCKEGRNVITLCQDAYILSVLRNFSLEDCKGRSSHLPAGGDFESREGQKFDKEKYQQAVGCLGYISSCTRLDIANAVCRLSQFSQDPNVNNWKGVQHVMRYLKETAYYCLTYRKGVGFYSCCDCDWARDLHDAISITGSVVKVNF